jgi:malonate transporter and related proteins
MLILTGYILKKYFIKEDYFWDIVEKLVYYLLLPTLLIKSIVSSDLNSIALGDFTLALVMPTFVLCLILVLYQKYYKMDNANFTSIFQGSIRYNSYVLLSMLLIMLPENGMLFFGIITIFMIVSTNLLSVLILSIYDKNGHKFQWKITFKKIILNPLILSSIVGLVLNLLGFGLPEIVNNYFTHLSHSALSLSLLAVGAGLKIKTLSSDKVSIVVPTVIKLLILPIFYFVTFYFIPLEDNLKIAIMIYGSVPTAGNAYILAKQMGGNYELMASIITVTTLVSILTMPIVIYLLV